MCQDKNEEKIKNAVLVANRKISNFVYDYNYPSYNTFDEGRIVYKTDSTWFVETYVKDHLGNVRVAYANDGVKDGIRQVNAYYPFGMNIKFLSANSTSILHRNEYLYNGKMILDELGLNWLDYGTRFYDPVVARWWSEDPMAEKYRRWSPYNYCVDNPMRYIDPDGKKIEFAPGTSQEYKDKFAATVKYMNSKGTSGLIAKLQASSQTYYLKETTGRVNSFNSKEMTIYWNANLAKTTNEYVSLSPATLLNHEVDHANQFDKNPNQIEKDTNPQSGKDSQYDNKEERRVIEGSEQKTAKKHGEISESQVTRKDHNMKSFIHVDDPTSNGEVVITGERSSNTNIQKIEDEQK